MCPAPSVPITTPSGSVASAARASAPSSPDVVGMMKTRLSRRGRVERRVARDLRPDRRVALGDAAERAHLRRGERGQRRRVRLAHARGRGGSRRRRRRARPGRRRPRSRRPRRRPRGSPGRRRPGAEAGRIAPVKTTGASASLTMSHSIAVSSSVSVPWVTTTPMPRRAASRAARQISSCCGERQVRAREVGDRLRLEALVAGEPGHRRRRAPPRRAPGARRPRRSCRSCRRRR